MWRGRTTFWSPPLHISGEGNGTPLQHSCLKNPMDGGAWQAILHGVAKSQTRLNDFTFTFHFHALEKEMATHSSVLAWRIPGMGEPGGLLSMGLHKVRYDWSDLAALHISWSWLIMLSLIVIFINIKTVEKLLPILENVFCSHMISASKSSFEQQELKDKCRGMSDSRWDLGNKWAWRDGRDQITQEIIYQDKEMCPKGNHRTVFFSSFFFLFGCSMWDLSSQTRYPTCKPLH